ncbi:nuclear pore complex protein Nup50 [Thalassophryne amazonica]|uniref:nuclear pore complex protein Nup50 n=1 Tax=Thalassophryne amazonica TaxID=390379 RepID=UPI001470907D|nr:nuclear pore complex protein Nup50 [Thalassophryne amazonica]XP_034019629.1 nuclear pore complex protein Nup50 [Thalassophryne amazonica]XP_034019630.1 nuclear pore complex protein Nup50 [Thalassophryne amazonica]
MAKRIADKQLTDRNWDQEDEADEAGTFRVASEDVLKNRAIKRAKRRSIGAENEGGGAFKGFKGFSLNTSAPSGCTTTTVFSGFGSSGGDFKSLSGLTNGNSITPSFSSFSCPAATTATSTGLTFNGPASTAPTVDLAVKQSNGSTPSATQSSCTSNKEYRKQLTALNCSVRDWITKHVNSNPLCDLNPIFRDYERHLATLDRQYGAGSAVPADSSINEKKPLTVTPPPAASASSSSSSSSAPAASSLFAFGKDAEKKSPAPPPAGVTFNFGQKVDASVQSSLGSKPTLTGFSFSSGQTSLFGAPSAGAPLSFSGSKPDNALPTEEGSEETEEPPKPDVREVKEEDAFYSKRCKMFYKKDSEFKEKGVGTLHLKETLEGKTQMIIRADTNLGNILLNIIVSASMPCSRVGKNNVMVVCIPNPPIEDKKPPVPIPLLIRVKTAEDADELHKILEEKKP